MTKPEFIKAGLRGSSYIKTKAALSKSVYRDINELVLLTGMKKTLLWYSLKTLKRDGLLAVRAGKAGGPKGNNPSNPTAYRLRDI